jgi:hypothetical protein
MTNILADELRDNREMPSVTKHLKPSTIQNVISRLQIIPSVSTINRTYDTFIAILKQVTSLRSVWNISTHNCEILKIFKTIQRSDIEIRSSDCKQISQLYIKNKLFEHIFNSHSL